MKNVLVWFMLLCISLTACQRKQPHIVFIVADDLGWNDVGLHNPDIKTPNIDKLAREGVILNQSYVQPLCSPSRHSIMTGYYPFKAGLQHLVILPWQPVCSPLSMKFLPQRLKELGYATHMVGKWHVGFCSWNCTPTYRGFDSFFGYYNAQEDYYNHSWYGALDLRNDTKPVRDLDGTYSLFAFEKRAKEILNNHDKNTPLFLYLPFQNVHDPIQVPKQYEDKYPNIKSDGRRKFSGMVSALDEAIGNITDKIKELGMYNDTLFAFTADNGGWIQYFGNNYPLRGGKFTVYEGGTRVIAFMTGAGITNKGTQYDGLMHAVDWSATLVSAAGGNPPSDGDGMDQWDAISRGGKPPRQEIVYNYDQHINPTEGHAAIRIGDWKLIDGYPGLYPKWYKPDTVYELPELNVSEKYVLDYKNNNGRYQLFNLKDDPTEHKDLTESNPDIVKQMSERLSQLTKSAIKPNYPEIPDPKSNPKHFDGAWSPGWC